MDLPMFPAEALAFRIPPPAITSRYFLLAYWPGGRWWRAFTTLHESSEAPALLAEAKRLAEKGWTHIRIIVLPEKV